MATRNRSGRQWSQIGNGRVGFAPVNFWLARQNPGSMCAIEILSTLPTPQSIRYFSTTEIVGFGSVSLMNASFLLEMTTAVVPLPTLPVPFPEME